MGEVTFSRTTNVLEGIHSQLNNLFPKRVGLETAICKIKDYKLKVIKNLAAREPTEFLGKLPKAAATKKAKRTDTERLHAIYQDVHGFSLLDPAAQIERLKYHLILVGGRRRVKYVHYEQFWDSTLDDLSYLSD